MGAVMDTRDGYGLGSNAAESATPAAAGGADDTVAGVAGDNSGDTATAAGAGLPDAAAELVCTA